MVERLLQFSRLGFFFFLCWGDVLLILVPKPLDLWDEDVEDGDEDVFVCVWIALCA